MTAINPVVTLELHDDIAVIAIDSPPVNALSAAVRAGLDQGLKQAHADEKTKAIIIICKGRTFIAGADITEFGKPPKSPMLGEVIETMDAATKHIIAAIHGTALGGGFEVALAAHYRVAAPDAKIGLPEIKLGLLPGAGGTQRLPRLIGVAQAADIILSGNPVPAKKALALGAIDEIIEGDLGAGALAFAKRLAAEGKPLRRTRDLDDRLAEARDKPEIFAAAREAHARRYRGFEAWEAALQSVRNAVEMPFEEGLRAERDLFATLVAGTQSKAQRHVFFAERQVAKVPDIGLDEPTLPVKSVGVIGAGTMGGGIAMNFLNAGLPVTIVEMKQDALDRGIATIARNYEATAAKGRIGAADVEARMALLTPTLDMGALKDCDLVIEAVFETMEIKKDVFGKLDAIAKPGAILASNTSYLDIDEIAAMTKRPGQVLGLHFFSPANVMKLLEIVRGAETAKPVIATAMQLAKTIGKVGVLVGVCHGFVGNRMLAQRQREANRLILEGAHAVGCRSRPCQAFGMPMGPFADGGPRRARPRLVEGDECERHRQGPPLRHGPARSEDGRRFLRL